MKTLADLIDEKAQSLDIQIQKARIVDGDEAEWIKCKKEVDMLDGDYEAVLFRILEQNSLGIRKYPRGKMMQIVIPMGLLNGYEVLLMIDEHTEKGVKKAYYIAFNSRGANCYIRYLVNNVNNEQFKNE